MTSCELGGLPELWERLGKLRAGDVDLIVVEREIQETLHAVGRDLMVRALKQADASAPEVEIAGARWGNRRSIRAKYMTVFGEVELERGVYQQAGRGPVAVPMELRLGIVEGRYTPVLARVACRAVALMPAEEAEGFLSEVGAAKLSVSTLHRMPRAVAARYEQRRDIIEPEVRRSHVVPAAAVTVQVALDGVMVPQDGEHAKRRGRKSQRAAPARHETRYGEGEEEPPAARDGKAGRAWHEASVGTLSYWDARGDRLSTVYLGRMPEYRKATLLGLLEAELRHTLQERPDLTVCFASDGALVHWDELEAMHERLRPHLQGEQWFLVDRYHVAEYLGECAALVAGVSTPESRVLAASWKETMNAFSDGTYRVLKALRYHRDRLPTATAKEEMQTAIDFLANQHNQGRTRYADAIAKNLPIGTGVTEAAAKTLVSVRMKRAGARFSQHGGQTVLLFRAAVLSERFSSLAGALESSYRASVREAA